MPSEQLLPCPWCSEPDFDLIGLKSHLDDCSAFAETEAINRLFATPSPVVSLSEMREALEGMVAAYDRTSYFTEDDARVTRECAMSIAKQLLDWPRATPPATAVATEGELPALDNVIENDPALKEAFEIQRPKSYLRRQDAAVAIDTWTDAGGHAWQLRPGINCVECPHCLFAFSAEHRVAPDGYDCPNCEGCPDAPAVATPSGAGGDELLRTAVHALESYKSGNVSPDLANEVIAAINAHFGTPAPHPESLVDCPRCYGLGFRADQDDKLCLCLIERSQGWTPGKLPKSIADRLHAPQPVAGKCGLCGHSRMLTPNGTCMAVSRDAGESLVYCNCKCEFLVPEIHTAANCEVCAAQQEALALGTPYSVSGHSVPTVAEDERNLVESAINHWREQLTEQSTITDEDAEDLLFRLIALFNRDRSKPSFEQVMGTTADDELDGNERGVLNVLAGNYHGDNHQGAMLECKLWPCRILIEATGRETEEVDTTIVEILGPGGTVHYRRPWNDKDVQEAFNTEGYSVRKTQG